MLKGGKKFINKISTGCLRNQLRHLRCKWDDIIKKLLWCEGVDWIPVVQNGDKRRAVLAFTKDSAPRGQLNILITNN